MSQRQQIRMLPDGRRLHLQDGPIDLVIGADGAPEAIAVAHRAAAERFATLLDELCAELSLLRSLSGPNAVSETARRMVAATRPYAQRTFMTPMAAVAGAGADTILAAMLHAAPLTRAHVNNGGDIALHLSPGTEYRIGMVDRPDRPALFGNLTIRAADGIGGIATSGRHGRSFSLGIADAVTVLAADAATADAAATMIANAVDLPGHPAVTRVAANAIQPDNDLGSRLITQSVGMLSSADIEKALSHGADEAQRLIAEGCITAGALHLAGETKVVGALNTVIPGQRPGDPLAPLIDWMPGSSPGMTNTRNKENVLHAAG